jgi:NADPH2:quinone reductase
MKIVRFYEYGGPEVLRVEEVPEPVPGPGEVRVRSEVIGVGVPDVLVRTGNDAKTWPLPMVPGNDVAGTVDAVGAGVTRLREGDRVYVTSRELPLRGGGYAEARTVPAKAPFVIPDGTAAEHVVTLGNYHVAWMLLHYAAKPQPGQTLLVHAAAGGVGSALVQLAKRQGLTVFGIAGGAKKARYVAELGADAAIDRNAEDVGTRIAELTDGQGVDFIYDSVAGPNFTVNFDMLAKMGKVVMFGYIAGKPNPDLYTPMGSDFSRNLGFQIFSIHYFDDKPEIRRPTMEQMIDMLTTGDIVPRIHDRLKLGDAVAAHRLLESGEVIGKLVLLP